MTIGKDNMTIVGTTKRDVKIGDIVTVHRKLNGIESEARGKVVRTASKEEFLKNAKEEGFNLKLVELYISFQEIENGEVYYFAVTMD